MNISEKAAHFTRTEEYTALTDGLFRNFNRENGHKPPELLTRKSAVELLCHLCCVDQETYKESEAMFSALADLMDVEFKTDKHHTIGTTFLNTKSSISDVASAEKSGVKIIKRLRGDFAPETEVRSKELSGFGAILLIKIIGDCALKLPPNQRGQYANLIEESFNYDRPRAAKLTIKDETRSAEIDCRQVELLGKEMAKQLRIHGTLVPRGM